MIRFSNECSTISLSQLSGFFHEWSKPPSPQALQRILVQSSHAIIAMEESSLQVVGYITALSDGRLSAFVPMIEVLPQYQRQGIGSTLVRRMLKKLASLAIIDLVYNPTLSSFYNTQDFSRYPVKIQYQYCPVAFMCK